MIWDYIKSSTTSELAKNRAQLYAQLKPDEIAYIKRYWVPKESQFLRIHTSKYANLGCYSSQRVKSFHPILKTLLNQQLSLEEATRHLGSTIVAVIKKRALEESQEGKNLPRTLDLKAFTYLVDNDTKFAISKISSEWEATKIAVASNSLLPIFVACIECELMLRYSLPCRHHLAQACLTSQPIPKSLIHPHWWIYGPKITQRNWIPSYYTIDPPIASHQNQYLEPRRMNITSTGLQIINAAEQFSGYNRVRYEDEVLRAQKSLLLLAQGIQEAAKIPIRMPDKVNKPA
jgi:hypothetical protein